MSRLSKLATALAAATAMGVAPAMSAAECENDFSTRTRADYIYACMQINGENQLVLAKCACSIDVIASLISHDDYIEAETIMSYTLRGGESTQSVKHLAAREKVHQLKLAQLEGELKCF
jgi:hypothetical protein